MKEKWPVDLQFKIWIQGLEEEIRQWKGMKIELTEFRNQRGGGDSITESHVSSPKKDNRYP